MQRRGPSSAGRPSSGGWWPVLGTFAAVLLLVGAAGLHATVCAAPPPAEAEPDPVATFFTKGPVPTLKIVLTPEASASLEKDPRVWVHATLREGEKTVYEDVAVHLKGSAGSFRTFDQKPGLTIRVDKFVKGRTFHGMAKFSLNNGVQDPTYFDEFVGAEFFLAAGYPAPQVTHARVWINDRDVGTYDLKEGFDAHFLKRRFPAPEGNLYDGGFCTDVDADLEKDVGKDKEDKLDLVELFAACDEKDPAKARAGIVAVLDVDRFLTFMALERMLCHWDGYCMNRNNYRLFIPKGGKAVFLPHGMDQLLVDPQASILDDPVGIVAMAVMRDPEWQAAYRKRINELLPLFTRPEQVLHRVDEEARRCSGPLGGGGSAPLAGQIKTRIAARAHNLAEQAALPAPKPLAIDKGGSFRVRNWRPVAGGGGAKVAQVNFAGERVLRVQAGPKGDSAGSWVSRVLLAPGTYRFEASAQTDGVVATAGPPPGGASLRATGAPDGPRLTGTSAWKPLKVEFTVAEPRNVELTAELRATAGEAVWKLGSFRLVRTQ